MVRKATSKIIRPEEQEKKGKLLLKQGHMILCPDILQYM